MSQNGNNCAVTPCSSFLIPSNSATNFKNPTFSVKRAVEQGLIRRGDKILEVGSGNLRNSLFIIQTVENTKISAFDLDDTISRFDASYSKFQALGGTIVDSDFKAGKYDVVVSTYVVETICPANQREQLVRSYANTLTAGGRLITSFRGMKGVFGTKYRNCPLGEGLISPLKTFIKPFNVSDAKSLLLRNGFGTVEPLMRYRVDDPQNIHLIARVESTNG